MIQAVLREEFENKTVITVAHRLETIMDYDLVLVMDKGRLVESGSPSILAQRPGSWFHNLLNSIGSSEVVE